MIDHHLEQSQRILPFQIASARLSAKDQDDEIGYCSSLNTCDSKCRHSGGVRPGNPPWWLVHLGRALAAFVMLVLGYVTHHIYRTTGKKERRKVQIGRKTMRLMMMIAMTKTTVPACGGGVTRARSQSM